MIGRRRRHPADTPETIYLIAPAGHPNFGDEFIARTWLRHLAIHRPRARVILDCHTPGQASILLAGAHPDVLFVDTVWRLIAGLEDRPAVESADHIARVLDRPGIEPLLIDGIELLRTADTIHLVGGGYLNALWRRHLSILAAAVAVRGRTGAHVYATGQGLLPAGDPGHLATLRALLAQTTLTDLRDDASDRLLGPSGADRRSVTGDDAWLGVCADGVYSTGSAAATRTFVICVQTHLMDPDGADGVGVGAGSAPVVDALESRLVVLAERWGLTAQNTCFVEAMPGDDGVLHRRFEKRMPGVPLIPFTEVWRNGFPAHDRQLWITTRFHAHLLAAARGASGVVLTGRADYYPVKHGSLVDQGSRWHTVDDVTAAGLENRGAAASFDGGFPREVVRDLVEGKRALAQTLYPPR